MSTKDLARPSRAELERNQTPRDVMNVTESLSTRSEDRAIEVSARAMAERERAQIEAMFVVAQKYPRDWDNVEQELLAFCQNPIFADAAVWERSVGSAKNDKTGKWEEVIGNGLSIRFAEAAVQSMGNVYIASDITAEFENARICRSVVVDVQKNVVWAMPDAISKQMDRKFLKDGDVPLRTRTNSKNEPVYTIQAPEDAIRSKMNGALSRTQRNNILRLLPAHIKQACWETLEETFDGELKGEKRQKTIDKMVRAFDVLGVTAAMLQDMLGHSIAQVTDDEVNYLRGVRNKLVEKINTWEEIMQARNAEPEGTKADETKAAGPKEDQPKPTNGGKQAAPTQATGEAQGAGVASSGAQATTDQPKTNGGEPAQQETLISGLSITQFDRDEFARVKSGLKALGKANNQTQIEDFLSRWATDKPDLLAWIEEELQKKSGLKKD